MTLVLPWPPSVNKLYSQGGHGGRHGRRLHPAHVAYRERVIGRVIERLGKLPPDPLWDKRATLRLSIRFYPPDRRKRDTSNLLKAIEDALQAARVVEDDVAFFSHRLDRVAIDRPHGRIEVTIEPR